VAVLKKALQKQHLQGEETGPGELTTFMKNANCQKETVRNPRVPAKLVKNHIEGRRED